MEIIGFEHKHKLDIFEHKHFKICLPRIPERNHYIRQGNKDSRIMTGLN